MTVKDTREIATPAASENPSEDLQKTVRFLTEIGLECEFEPGATGFLTKVRIESGTLFIDPAALPADVLHEAGHLAVLPGRFRPLAGRDIGTVQKMMYEQVDFSDPDHGEARAAMQSGDPEATAWAWAAGKHIGLDPKKIIEGASYGGDGDSIRFMLQANRYIGINGLSAAKFCVTPPGRLGPMMKLPTYPTLAMWLQPDFGLDPLPSPSKKRPRP